MQQTLSRLLHAFSSTIESCVVSVRTGLGGWVYYLFSLKQFYMLKPGLSVAIHKWSLALEQLFWYLFSLLCHKYCKKHLLGPVYGEIVFFPLLDNGPNSAHWNIQKYKNPAVSMLCNNKVVKVLKKALCFYHHKIFLVTRWSTVRSCRYLVYNYSKIMLIFSLELQ